MGAGGPCDVACADEIWRASIEVGSPPTVLSARTSACTSMPLPVLAVTGTISPRALRSVSGSSWAADLAFWSHCFSAWTFDHEGGFPLES